jgi:hypothetical protein
MQTTEKPPATFYELNPPAKWEAASTGSGERRKPIYFSCGDCGAREPEIAAYIGWGTSFFDVAIIPSETSPFHRPAMFCAACYEERKNGRPPRPWNPPPAESWPELEHRNIVKDCYRWRWKSFAANFQVIGWNSFRGEHQHRKRLEGLLVKVLSRHLEKGGSVIEGQRTEWTVAKGNFVDSYNTPDYIAKHIANRVIGFGWTVALKPLCTNQTQSSKS